MMDLLAIVVGLGAFYGFARLLDWVINRHRRKE
jgi:hypothetical protein